MRLWTPSYPSPTYLVTMQSELDVHKEYTYQSDTEGSEMPQNRNTVKATLILSAEQAHRMQSTPDMRLLMYCGQSKDLQQLNNLAEVAFPNQIELRVNDDEVKWNFKGLKNKPGSTKPCDLARTVRAKAGYVNQITVTYALTNKRFAFAVYMVRYISSATLTERIKTASVIPKEKVLEEMRRANADPDIEATSTRMSLKDPISTVRIELPVRSTVCTHTQCFDGTYLMRRNPGGRFIHLKALQTLWDIR